MHLENTQKPSTITIKSLEIAKRIGDVFTEVKCYTNLGLAADDLGEYPKAIDYHTKSLAIAIRIEDKEGESTCYTNLGLAAHALGEYPKAIDYHNHSLELAEEDWRCIWRTKMLHESWLSSTCTWRIPKSH